MMQSITSIYISPSTVSWGAQKGALTYHEFLRHTVIHGVAGRCALHQRICTEFAADGTKHGTPLIALIIRFAAACGRF